MYKKMKEYFKDYNPEPNWVKEIKDKRAKDQEALETLGGSAAMADAISRMLRQARAGRPGRPRCLEAHPADEGEEVRPEEAGLGPAPDKWVDDPANFDDGKTNKTRLVGTYARFANEQRGQEQVPAAPLVHLRAEHGHGQQG